MLHFNFKLDQDFIHCYRWNITSAFSPFLNYVFYQHNERNDEFIFLKNNFQKSNKIIIFYIFINKALRFENFIGL